MNIFGFFISLCYHIMRVSEPMLRASKEEIRHRNIVSPKQGSLTPYAECRTLGKGVSDSPEGCHAKGVAKPYEGVSDTTKKHQ